MLDGAFRLTRRLFLGDLARYGLSSHPDGGSTERAGARAAALQAAIIHYPLPSPGTIHFG
jgi:hypothetical protein